MGVHLHFGCCFVVLMNHKMFADEWGMIFVRYTIRGRWINRIKTASTSPHRSITPLVTPTMPRRPTTHLAITHQQTTDQGPSALPLLCLLQRNSCLFRELGVVVRRFVQPQRRVVEVGRQTDGSTPKVQGPFHVPFLPFVFQVGTPIAALGERKIRGIAMHTV